MSSTGKADLPKDRDLTTQFKQAYHDFQAASASRDQSQTSTFALEPLRIVEQLFGYVSKNTATLTMNAALSFLTNWHRFAFKKKRITASQASWLDWLAVRFGSIK